MSTRLLDNFLSELCGRALTDGGFAEQPAGTFHSDATAWAILALKVADSRHELAEAARSRLAAAQMKNGSVPASNDAPDAYWPTPLAVLAWHGSPLHMKQHDLAVDFLLKTIGKFVKRENNKSVMVDRGWPWVAGTHCWVVPTAMTMLALTAAGQGGHQRVVDGVEILMRLQLPHGGWNYGSTVVFDQELLPQTDCTGIALTALAGCVPRDRVQRSIDYLARQISEIRTPLSLGWGLIGLGSWGLMPPSAAKMVTESRQLYQKYGPFSSTLLSLLTVAVATNGNLVDMFSIEGARRGPT